MPPSATPKGRKEKTPSSSNPTEEKYKLLKRQLKETLEAHDHITSKLKRARSKISHLKREKDLLLDRLERYERPALSDSESESASSSNSSNSDVSSESSDAPQNGNGRKAKRLKTAHAVQSQLTQVQVQQQPSSSREPTPSKSSGRGRVKRPPVVSRLRKIQHVPRDEYGQPVLPLHMGIFTLFSLGTIVHDRKAFHTERYIYPVGYKMSRSYASTVNPDKQTSYTCSISDGGESPLFHITPEDAPENPVTATTATGAWTVIIKAANAIRHRETSNSASGPDYFGISHPTVLALIQELPNANLCEGYVIQEFEETTGRSAKRSLSKSDKPSDQRLPSASPLPSSDAYASPSYASPHATPRYYPAAVSNFEVVHRPYHDASSPRATAPSEIPEWSDRGSAVYEDDLNSRETSMEGEVRSGEEGFAHGNHRAGGASESEGGDP
ncbi:hypothetical protein HDU88_001236 [Geranomyces variabilis]|nr:hypothetical protein HDU88_001236 [Geranomyces variabilis]